MGKLNKEYRFDYEDIGLNVFFESHDYNKITKAYDKYGKRSGWVVSEIHTRKEEIGSDYSGYITSSGSINLTKHAGETIYTYTFSAYKKYEKTTIKQMEKLSKKYDNLLEDEDIIYEELKTWKCILALFFLFLSIALLDGSIRFLIKEPNNGSDAVFKMASYFLGPLAAISIVCFFIFWTRNSYLFNFIRWKIKFGIIHKKLEHLK